MNAKWGVKKPLFVQYFFSVQKYFFCPKSMHICKVRKWLRRKVFLSPDQSPRLCTKKYCKTKPKREIYLFATTSLHVLFSCVECDVAYLTTALHNLQTTYSLSYTSVPETQPHTYTPAHPYTLISMVQRHPGATPITQYTGVGVYSGRTRTRPNLGFYTWTYANQYTHSHTPAHSLFYTPQSHWDWTLWLMTFPPTTHYAHVEAVNDK